MATSVDLWSGRALVVAPLGRVGMHAHAADAMLLGTDGAFRVRAYGGGWHVTRAAHVPARLRHELDCGDVRMMVLYLAPGRADARQLCARWDLSMTDLGLGTRCPAAPMEELARAIIGGTSSETSGSTSSPRACSKTRPTGEPSRGKPPAHPCRPLGSATSFRSAPAYRSVSYDAGNA